jgi:hypothetical protein
VKNEQEELGNHPVVSVYLRSSLSCVSGSCFSAASSGGFSLQHRGRSWDQLSASWPIYASCDGLSLQHRGRSLDQLSSTLSIAATSQRGKSEGFFFFGLKVFPGE